MVGLFFDGWYPSEEKAVMIIPLFTMAASLLTMAFPILMLISGRYTSFVPWLILISDILLGLALLSTFSQRRVLILHRGALSAGLFVTTFRVASKTSAGYGVQFRKEWVASKYLKLDAKRLGHWKIINAKPTNGLMAISRTSRQLAVMYCRFEDDGCWLHLDVFSQDIFNLEHFLFEEA